MPGLNRPAPPFKAITTHGQRRLEDYRGKWLMLFSHPADFTPVCTTEFIGLLPVYWQAMLKGQEWLARPRS
jgi:peroxiredoxin (alkyl hydroperoxide reductase subunit C)